MNTKYKIQNRESRNQKAVCITDSQKRVARSQYLASDFSRWNQQPEINSNHQAPKNIKSHMINLQASDQKPATSIQYPASSTQQPELAIENT
ncbi:MAG: hypothetical protein JXL67_09820 [Calditrichaeota bacterium]|nr:hypothetical protein [Calditrichota bacterium]